MVQAFLDALPQSSDARWCPRGLGAVRQRHPGPLPAQYETYPCGVPVGALHRQRRVSKVFLNAAVEPATGYWSLTLFEDAERPLLVRTRQRCALDSAGTRTRRRGQPQRFP